MHVPLGTCSRIRGILPWALLRECVRVTPNAAKDAAVCDVLCRGNPDDQLPPAQGIGAPWTQSIYGGRSLPKCSNNER